MNPTHRCLIASPQTAGEAASAFALPTVAEVFVQAAWLGSFCGRVVRFAIAPHNSRCSLSVPDLALGHLLSLDIAGLPRVEVYSTVAEVCSGMKNRGSAWGSGV